MGRGCGKEAVEREAEDVTKSVSEPSVDGVDRAAGSGG